MTTTVDKLAREPGILSLSCREIAEQWDVSQGMAEVVKKLAVLYRDLLPQRGITTPFGKIERNHPGIVADILGMEQGQGATLAKKHGLSRERVRQIRRELQDCVERCGKFPWE